MAARLTQAMRAAKNFSASVSAIDFEVREFVVYLIGVDERVQDRILDIFMSFVDGLAMRLDEGLYDQTNHSQVALYVKAKRMQDAMLHFR